MRAFFWPSKLNPSPSALTRFGRVLHWLGVALATTIWIVSLILVGYAIYARLRGDFFDPVYATFVVLFWLVVGFLVMLIGRALRYIFSGE